jgi:hypothetical protein
MSMQHPDSSEELRVVLNAHQRRHFEVLFTRLEDSLARVESLLGEDAPAPGAMLSLSENDVPPGYRGHAAPILAALREQIGGLASALALHPRRVSRSRTIGATLNAEAIRVEDSLSRNLRGYGDVDPSVARLLDPILTGIARTLKDLAAAARSRAR